MRRGYQQRMRQETNPDECGVLSGGGGGGRRVAVGGGSGSEGDVGLGEPEQRRRAGPRVDEAAKLDVALSQRRLDVVARDFRRV